MAEPAPPDNPVTATTLNGQPCGLVQEIVRAVQGQFPDATPIEVTNEVRRGLNRLERARQATKGSTNEASACPSATPPSW